MRFPTFLLALLCSTAVAQYAPPKAPSADPGYLWFKQYLISIQGTLITCPTVKKKPNPAPKWLACGKSKYINADLARTMTQMATGGTQIEPFDENGVGGFRIKSKIYVLSVQDQGDYGSFVILIPTK
jgi:hypothetical protein